MFKSYLYLKCFDHVASTTSEMQGWQI